MQTAVNRVHTILEESKLSPRFWPEALKYFCYTWNCICPKSLSKIPFEMYGGRKASVRHLKPFGRTAYMGIPHQKRSSKLDPKAKKGYIVGYAFNTKGYRIWIPETDQIVQTISVSFREIPEAVSDSSGVVLGPESCDPFSTDSGENQDVDAGGIDSWSSFKPPSIPPDSRISGEGVADSKSESKPEEAKTPSKRDVRWLRKPVKRLIGNRTDIYYFEEGKMRN